MSYQELLQRLFATNFNGGIKFDLDNINRLSALFKFPERQFQTIHVAGTNGKGSVTTKIAAALQFDGKRVGLYTSPHISTFRERIRINGSMIHQDELSPLLSEIFSVVDEYRIPATYFEITTLLAFIYFARKNVDIAVIETGLGGRLDATNIIHPILTAITSISFDHCDVLGDTLEQIAIEKAGIIKPGCPIILGPRAMAEVIAPLAKKLSSPVVTVEGIFDDFNSENNAIAKCCLNQLHASPQAIEHGLKQRPPCRIEVVELSTLPINKRPHAIVMDVAHNPDGIEKLFQVLLKNYPGKKFRTVFGLSRNKDLEGCIRTLVKFCSSFHPICATNWDVHSIEQLDQTLANSGIEKSNRHPHQSIEHNLSRALDLASSNDEVLVICGSFYIMAPIKAYFGMEVESDI